jgi:hypothetical protein
MSDDSEWTPAVQFLRQYGVLPVSNRYAGRLAKSYGNFVGRGAGIEPVAVALELEAVRQTIQLGHETVTTGHLLVAALSILDQLKFAGTLATEDGKPFTAIYECLGNLKFEFARSTPASVAHVVAKDLASKDGPSWRNRSNYPRWTAGAGAVALNVGRASKSRQAVVFQSLLIEMLTSQADVQAQSIASETWSLPALIGKLRRLAL